MQSLLLPAGGGFRNYLSHDPDSAFQYGSNLLTNMVISYSHSEWFVPTLQGLTDPKRSSPRICVWHKSRRAPKKDGAHLIKCSSLIAEQDAKRADQLVKNLRNDLSTGHECLKILQEVSSLLLCKRTHRSSNADEIYKFWMAELESPEQSRKSVNQDLSSPTRDPSSQPSTPSKVLQELGIMASSKFKCHGQGKEGNMRGNCTSQSSRRRTASVSNGLAGEWHISPTVLELFGEQPEPGMCRLWHQDQATIKLEDWTCAFNFDATMRTGLQFHQTPTLPYTSIRQSTKCSYKTDDSSDIETSHTQSSHFWTPSRRPQSLESNATTPMSGSDGIRATTTSPLADNLMRHVSSKPGHLSLSPTSTPRQARSQVKDTTNGCAGPGLASPIEDFPAFAPLTTVRSPLEAAKYLAEKIRRDISSSEFEPGFVYGFRRPGCDLIKIGFTTKTIAERMKIIESVCGFNVTVVFAINTNYAKKVEGLVHKHLYKQRRRERCCNGDKGRHPTQHREWFEDVSDEYAESVVRAWVRWINLEPYDGEGRLKEVWLEQLRLFNLHTSGDLWMQWTKIIQGKEFKEEPKEDAVIQVEIKTERVLHAAPWLSGPGRPLISGFPCWKEIKGSLHGVRAPTYIPRLQMVSA